jgi:hypothetical protein
VVRRLAGEEAQHVLVVARAPGRRRRGRARQAPAPGEVTRATVIEAEPLAGDDAAQAWLRDAAGPAAGAVVAAARDVLDRVLHAHRLATACAVDLGPGAALVTRVGYGTGEDVADGRWREARELPARAESGRERALRPQERFAALLGGRDAALACELLALRARLDLDQGRSREAALQLEAALAAAREELQGWRELPGLAARLDELAGRRATVGAAAAAARAGELDAAAADAVAAALVRLEAALRARTAAAPF